jgi:hypothetical protein
MRPGLLLPSPPENRLSVVCAVTPCRTRISVVGVPLGGPQPCSDFFFRVFFGAGSDPPTVTPDRNPSSASFASRSACLFCSRGTQVYVVPNGASALASVASGRIPGCLIFHRPDICSTTSLESIRTSISASGANSWASFRPAISPEYSATLLVASPSVLPSSASTSPVSASFRSAPYAAGPGLPRDPPSASTITRRGASVTARSQRCGPGSAGTPRTGSPGRRPRT